MKLVSMQKQKPRAEQASFNKNSRELFEELCDWHSCEEGKPSVQYVRHEVIRAYELLLAKFGEFAPMLRAIEKGAKVWERQFSVSSRGFTTKTIDDLLAQHNVLSDGRASHSTLMLPAGYASVETEDDSALMEFSEIYKAVKLGDETIPVLDAKDREKFAERFDKKFYSAQKFDITEQFQADMKEILAEVLLPWHAVASDEQAFGKMLGLLETYHLEVYALLGKNFESKEGISNFIESYAQRSLEEDISAGSLEEKVSASVAKRISAPMIAGLMALAGGAAAAATAGSAGAAESGSTEIIKDVAGDVVHHISGGQNSAEITDQEPKLDILSVKSTRSGKVLTVDVNLAGAPDTNANYFVDIVTDDKQSATISATENKITYQDGMRADGTISKTEKGFNVQFNDVGRSEVKFLYIMARKGDNADFYIDEASNYLDIKDAKYLLQDKQDDVSVDRVGAPPRAALEKRKSFEILQTGITDNLTTLAVLFADYPLDRADSSEIALYTLAVGDMNAMLMFGSTNINMITYSSSGSVFSNKISVGRFNGSTRALLIPFDKDLVKIDKTFGNQLRVSAMYTYVDNLQDPQNMLTITDMLVGGNSAPIDKQIVNQTPSQPPNQPPTQPPIPVQDLEKIKNFTPTILHDSRPDTQKVQLYTPYDPHADDLNITNNHENFDAGKFPNENVVHTKVVNGTSYDYYVYIYERANNPHWAGLAWPFAHEHDTNFAIVKVDKRTDRPVALAVKYHTLGWDVKQVSDVSQLKVYSENGAHEFFTSPLPTANGNGLVLTKDNVRFAKLEDRITDDDINSRGFYGYLRTDEPHPSLPSGVKAPWLADELKDPENLVFKKYSSGNWQNSAMWFELHSPADLEVVVDGITTSKEKSDIPNSGYASNKIGILGISANAKPKILVKGTGSGEIHLYGYSIAGEVLKFDMAAPIKAGQVYEVTPDWQAIKENSNTAVTVRIDANGDGTFEKTITQDKAITADEVKGGKSNAASAVGGNAAAYVVGGIAILAVAGGVAYYFRGRREDKDDGETGTLDTVVETRANRGSLGQENRSRFSLEDAAGRRETESLEKELETPEAQIRHYSALAEKSPGKPGHWYRLAKAYSSSGKWDEAKAAIDKAIEVAGENNLKPEYFDLAAQACEKLGKPERAQRARECAEELRSSSEKAD